MAHEVEEAVAGELDIGIGCAVIAAKLGALQRQVWALQQAGAQEAQARRRLEALEEAVHATCESADVGRIKARAAAILQGAGT